MLLQPLDAEDLFAQDLVVAPVRARRQLFEDFAEKWMQESTSLLVDTADHYARIQYFAHHVFTTMAPSDFAYVVGCNSLAGRRGSARTGRKFVAIYAASSAAADVGDDPAAATRIFLTRMRE